ncbi:MAG: hypothetical protein ACFE8V_03240 [Promethearchaeota archaeon]
MRKKHLKVFPIISILFLSVLYLNNYLELIEPNSRNPDNDIQLKTSRSGSVLFNNFTYEWYAIINNNPLMFYTGVENYTYLGGTTFRCNETVTFQYNPPNTDSRDVNNITRHFPASFFWGDDKHDWVWIFRNTTINTRNIPIATFEAGSPEEEHLFNVTGERIVNLNGNNFNVWIVEDKAGSIANYEKNTGILINGTFYFAGTQTWTIEMTNTNAQIPANDNPPVLNNPEVSPPIGDLTTEFTFTVNYSDLDNNLPNEVNVIINDTLYSMVKQNSSDFNYIDGVIYEYKTYLPNGTYQYFFNASDGIYSTNTSIQYGPDVSYVNSFVPTLSDSSIYPLLGYNTSTLFQYSVKFSDLDNNFPIYVNLAINNTIYSMKKENILDLNYMDGTFYEFEVYLNDTGYYIYNFTASDGENIVNLPSVGFYYNPNVTLHNLNGIDIGWITTHGETSNTTYSTFLTDAISLGASSIEYNQKINPYSLYPFEMLIIEEGGNSWTNEELIILKNWIENGGRLIIIGDNRDDAQTSVSNMLNVRYSSYSGTAGSSNQILQPHYLTVNVDSINFGLQQASIDLGNSDPSLSTIINASDGTPQVCLLEMGLGKALWIIDETIEDIRIMNEDNRIFGLNVLRWMSDLKTNNFIPSFTNPQFNPPTGNSTTFFTFAVTYTDIDNRGPIYINVTINQDSFSMVKQDNSDYDYVNGVIFQYTTTLQSGPHQYYFNASDGDNEINSLSFVGPNVGYINDFNPTLTSGKVSPAIGFENTVFTYQVNYSDADNNEPIYVNVTINGISYNMDKKNPFDNYFIDGVIYEFKTTLNKGFYEYFFNTSDAERAISTSVYFGPNVYTTPLENKKIAWITTHGEESNSLYTKILSDAIKMGASVTTFNSEINITTLRDFDIIVINDGGVSWDFNELDALEKRVINGSSILILGDERDASQVSVSSKFKVSYSTQSGTSGNSSYILGAHNVTFGVSTVYFPYPESTISPNSNEYLTPLINERGGRLVVASLQYGSGRILWVVDDTFTNSEINKLDNNLLSNNSWIWLAKTRPNINTPIINDVGVTPISGNSRTLFTFSLNYSDPDASGPVFVEININDTIYLLTKQDKYDFNYITGVIYNFSIQLSPGNYYYHYNVSDGMFNVSYPIGELLLTVSSVNLVAPSIISTDVVPYLGFGNSSLFTFQAIYQDEDNAPPNYVYIYLDETQYSMAKLDPNDLSYYDGAIYQFQINLTLGEHRYSIEAYDGIYLISAPPSGNFLGPIVVEKDLLSSKQIGWITTHGEDSYTRYTIYLNDAVFLGATFTEITQTITFENLREFDICFVGEGGSPWTYSELAALATWVYSGKSLFIIGDDRDPAMVNVSQIFDVRYKSYSDSLDYTTDIFKPHILTNGLNQLYIYPYTAIDEDLSTSRLTKLVRDKNGELIVATLSHGGGKITWICDDDIIRNAYINEVDNRLFANNTWLWSLQVVHTPIDQDGTLLIIIIVSSSIGGVIIIGVTIYLMKRKKRKKAERLIGDIIDEIQPPK